jgi:hypothetical protein
MFQWSNVMNHVSACYFAVSFALSTLVTITPQYIRALPFPLLRLIKRIYFLHTPPPLNKKEPDS